MGRMCPENPSFLRMISPDLASPVKAGFEKAGNRVPLFAIMRWI
jgi:hypothetical protein